MNFIVYQGQKKDIEKDTFPIENSSKYQPSTTSFLGGHQPPLPVLQGQVSDLPPLPTGRPPCVAVQYVALTTVHLEDRDALSPTIDGWWRAQTFLARMTRWNTLGKFWRCIVWNRGENVWKVGPSLRKTRDKNHLEKPFFGRGL